MPEGPSIVLLKEALQPFVDEKIINADGSSKKVEYGRLPGAKIRGHRPGANISSYAFFSEFFISTSVVELLTHIEIYLG